MSRSHAPQDWVGAWSEKRAALTPDRVGLVDATTGDRFTYAELHERATRTARLLGEQGVDSSESVAVISRNRPEVVDLFFATGLTGATLAPVSHRLAPPEIGELLERVDPGLLVVERRFDGPVATALSQADVECPVLTLESDGDTADSGAEPLASASDFESSVPASTDPVDADPVAPQSTHLLLHTGGSTGVPKETCLTHAGIVWNSLNTITAWGLRDDDVTPMVFPLFHTGGWNVLTVPLWHMGGTVVIARDFDPGQVLRVIDEEGGSVLVAVPAVLRMMTEHDRWAATDLSTLRFVKSGGGPCRQAVMERWWDRGVDLSQGYGLTECGPNNFAMPEGWPDENADAVGVPAMHVDARVVEDGRPVERGTIGELELRSPHAAEGYLDNTEETAATFGDDGWVATGDLARVDADGYYYIEGRKKHMFVSGGENVYPAEVEDAVADYPPVEEVVVVPVSDETWGQVGRAVVESEQEFTVEDLRAFLDDRLARFKHPRSVVFVDELPMAGPSKIDREAVARTHGEQ